MYTHEGELDVEIVQQRTENDDDESNPNPEDRLQPNRKYSMKQRKVRRLLRLKIARQAAYHAPIFAKSGKRTQFTFKHKLPAIKCDHFLSGVGCDRHHVTHAIMVIYDQNQSQRQRDNNKSKASHPLREEEKIVKTTLKINGLGADSISLAQGVLLPPCECNSYDKMAMVNKQQKKYYYI